MTAYRTMAHTGLYEGEGAQATDGVDKSPAWLYICLDQETQTIWSPDDSAGVGKGTERWRG